MSGAIFYIGDELAMRHDGIVGADVVENGADGFDYFDIGLFVASANLVSLADSAFGQHGANGVAVISNVHPVAHIFPVTVNGQRLTLARIQNHEWNELFGKLVWAVVVGAVGGGNRKLVRVMISTHQVIGSRFRGGVRAIGLVALGLAECRITGGQGAVDFVGRDVEEAKLFLIFLRRVGPIGARFLQQAKGAVYVGADEIVGTENRAVHVAFGGEVDNSPWPLAAEQFAY